MSALITRWWGAPPSPGDIVWCHFPEIPNKPGPKPRPALVIAVDDSNPKRASVQVVYGTSQKTDRLYRGEFLISKSRDPVSYALAGLSYDTKFDFNQMVTLPYNSDWFAVSPHDLSTTPVLGTLHASMYKVAGVAYKELD